MAKKFGKFLLTVGSIAAAAAGAYYYLSQKSDDEDFDFDDFDDDDEVTAEESGKGRSYVDLDLTDAKEAAGKAMDAAKEMVKEANKLLEEK